MESSFASSLSRLPLWWNCPVTAMAAPQRLPHLPPRRVDAQSGLLRHRFRIYPVGSHTEVCGDVLGDSRLRTCKDPSRSIQQTAAPEPAAEGGLVGNNLLSRQVAKIIGCQLLRYPGLKLG